MRVTFDDGFRNAAAVFPHLRKVGFERAYGLARGRWDEPYALPRLDLYRIRNPAKTVKASLSA